MKKKLFSFVLVFVLCFSSIVPVFASVDVPSVDVGTNPLSAINDVLNTGKTMLDIAGTVATTGAEIAARTSERRYYDTLTAMAQGGSGVFAARGGGTNYTNIIDASTTSINYIDTSTNRYTTNNYNEIYYNSTYNTYYATTNNYDYYITYAPTYTYVTYVGATAEWDSRQEVCYYFELPDGRNSYDLTAKDVYGMVFDYDVKNYNSVVEDDGKTLGLYHFDGNVFDSSANKQDITWNTGASVTYLDSNAFDACLYLDGSEHSFTVPTNVGTGDFTLEFRFYAVPVTTKSVAFSGVDEQTLYWFKLSDRTYQADGATLKTDVRYATSTIDPRTSYVDSPPLNDASWGHDYEVTLYYTTHYLFDYDSSKYILLDGDVVNSGSVWPDASSVNHFVEHDLSSDSNMGVFEKSIAVFDIFDLGFGYLQMNKTDNKRYSRLDIGDLVFTNVPAADYSATGTFGYMGNDGFENFPVGQWVNCSVVRSGGTLKKYFNGVLVDTVSDSTNYSEFTFDMATDCFQYCYIDELRVSNCALYSGSTYSVPSAPFDTNDVLVLPDNVKNKTVYIQSSEEVSDYRIGGVRPTYPVKGSVFVGLTSDYKVESIQQYNGSEWTLVRGAVGVDGTAQNLTGYSFAAAAVTPDTYPDPDNPGGGSGGGTTDPDDPGGGSTDTGSSIWEKIGAFFKGIGQGIGGLFSGLFDGILALFNTVLSLFQSLKGFGTGFVSFLGAMMPFIPAEIITILTAAVGVSVILLILKIFRK